MSFVSLFLMRSLVGLLKADYAPSSFQVALWGASGELSYPNYARAVLGHSAFSSTIAEKARVQITAPVDFSAPGLVTESLSQARIYDNLGNLLVTIAQPKTLQVDRLISLPELFVEIDQGSGAGLTNEEAGRWLDHIFRGESYTVRPTLYLDLYTAGNALADYEGYEQLSIAVATDLADPLDNGVSLASIQAAEELSFPVATSAGTAPLTNYKVWGESARINQVLAGTLLGPVNVEAGDIVAIPSGATLTSLGA